MKKFLKLFILSIICLLPVMVEAKANYSLDYEITNKALLYEENGIYYYVEYRDLFYGVDEVLYFYLYDKDGKYLGQEVVYDENKDKYEDVIKTKQIRKFMELYFNSYEIIYDETTGYSYAVDYSKKSLVNYNFTTGHTNSKLFTECTDFLKQKIGSRYELYMLLDSKGLMVHSIRQFGDYYVVNYKNNRGDNFVSLVGKDSKEIMRLFAAHPSDYFFPYSYIYGDLFYFFKDTKTIEIYSLDGNKVDSIIIEHEKLNQEIFDCIQFDGDSLYIQDNELFVYYFGSYICPSRVAVNDEKAALNVAKDLERIYYFVLKYSLDFDVIKKDVTVGGDFTYDRKFDEDGKEYVELNINPTNGYSVDKIIVTDVNGKEIEVINNKFYMPLSDVNVEVKFTNGEYIPIPDTFLSRSLTLSIIGLVLVGLGIYTFNYVRKVD